MKCGEDRFPKSKLAKLKRDCATLFHQKRPAPCNVANSNDESYGFSTKVLIHGWQRRRAKVKHKQYIDETLN